MAAIARFATTDDEPAILDALRADGAVLIDRFITSQQVAALNAEAAASVAAAEPGMRTVNPMVQAFFGPCTKHVSALAAVSPTFANEVMTHPTYKYMCDDLLLPSCARYRLNLGHLIARGPGAEAQIPHRDEDVWPYFPRPHDEIQVASMAALVDFRADNGATRVVPGSHRWPRARKPEPDEIADAVVPAGGAVMYLGSTIHYAGTNSTADEWRLGVHVSSPSGGSAPRRTTSSRSRRRWRARSRRRRRSCSATRCTTPSPTAAATSGWCACATRWSSSPAESSNTDVASTHE